MTTFQRARSDEQREIRRESILNALAAMLDEMPVSAVTLNELSRRVGLAKSNVMRYFESREAALLEMLDRAWKQWLAELPRQLSAEVDPRASAELRGEQVAAVVAESVAQHRTFCDLLSAQASVLERNVSPEVAARYKRAAIADVTALAQLLDGPLPELGPGRAAQMCAAITMMIGAVWSHSQPSSSMHAAYDADPTLAALRMEFVPSLRQAVELLIVGALPRAT